MNILDDASTSNFEDILNTHLISFEKISVSETENEKTPDYLLNFEGVNILAELKAATPSKQQFENYESREKRDYSGDMIVGRKIRILIDKAHKQIKEYKRRKPEHCEAPSIVAIYNAFPFEMGDPTEGHHVKAAMHGEFTIEKQLDGSINYQLGKNKKADSESRTKTISAVVVIEVNKCNNSCFTIYHNSKAKFPLPKHFPRCDCCVSKKCDIEDVSEKDLLKWHFA